MNPDKTPILKIDCRYFKGDKPCVFFKQDCFYPACKKYAQYGTRILIIKLAAIGDVLRTTPILPALKKKYPRSYIVWVTEKAGCEVLAGNRFINEILALDFKATLRLQVERFDILINLDKDMAALSLAETTKAEKKIGFGLSEYGRAYAFNPEAEYAFRLSFSDQLKFRENKKTYQQIIFEAAGIDAPYGEYVVKIPKQAINFGRQLFKKIGIKPNQLKFGLNLGAGKVFATKKWPTANFIKLIKLISRRLKAQIILLGGPEEKEISQEIKAACPGLVFDSGCSNSLRQFIGIVNACDIIVTADTLALHLAVALKKPVIALFGPTAANEVDLYGRGEKIVSKVKCGPCYRNKCPTRACACMKAITAEQVFEKIIHATSRTLQAFEALSL